jgi:hypothetical protein
LLESNNSRTITFGRSNGFTGCDFGRISNEKRCDSIGSAPAEIVRNRARKGFRCTFDWGVWTKPLTNLLCRDLVQLPVAA